jgi:hypothetical protein
LLHLDIYEALQVLPDDKGSFSPTTLLANIDHAGSKTLISTLGSSSGSGSSQGKAILTAKVDLDSSDTHAAWSDICSSWHYFASLYG